MISLVGPKNIGKLSKWTFISALTFWGPGPLIAVLGTQGFFASMLITQTNIIEHTTKLIL